MSESLSAFLSEDHRRLGELLDACQEWKPRDIAKAQDFLAQFAAGLSTHLQWEETILFPAFEQKTGKTGLTHTLLAEHKEIREWLEALGSKLAQNDPDSGREQRMLIEELGGHNAREEYALYPELDRLLTDEEKQRIFAAMACEAVPAHSMMTTIFLGGCPRWLFLMQDLEKS